MSSNEDQINNVKTGAYAHMKYSAKNGGKQLLIDLTI